VSNEIDRLFEPSLVLTPIQENNSENDGLLTASEVSELDMDAEIVLLSACNTASSFGESNSQGLSGLANSFFNAGAKSLLVSYWSVISESAVDVTTRIFKPSNNGRSYAHKHRNAVLDLLQNSKDIYKLHPSYWAPFSIIGVN
jgi:CHAT domain-containing protein